MEQSKIIKEYNWNYKKNIFVKYNLSIIVYNDFLYFEGIFYERGVIGAKSIEMKLQYEDLKNVYVDGNMLFIEKKNAMMGGVSTYCFPDFNERQEALEIIKTTKEERITELNRRMRVQKSVEESKYTAFLAQQAEVKKFYNDCMEFHIRKDNNLFHRYYETETTFSGLYFSKNKELCFLTIDANKKSEVCAMIEYKNIHYYERAGSVHYVTETKAHQRTSGGYYVGGSMSASSAIIGGLLFGQLGLVAGAMMSYKPAQYVSPTTSIEYKDETKEIDDRTVILNYFSDIKQQYMDVALPQETYNFLQTVMPEKRYETVCVVESEKIARENAEKNEQKMLEDSNTKKSSDDNLEQIVKLKELFDAGILTEDEFVAKKKQLLGI